MRRIPPEVVETLEEGNPPTFEEVDRQPEELDAEKHWRRFQPTLVKSLEAQSPTALAQAIRNAWHQMRFQQGLLQADGMPEALAQTVYRELLWPPPETDRIQARSPLISF